MIAEYRCRVDGCLSTALVRVDPADFDPRPPWCGEHGEALCLVDVFAPVVASELSPPELDTRHNRDGVTMLRGDSLDVLRSVPTSSVDAVITDPPYSSGGLHRSDRNRSTGDKYVQTGTKVQRPDFQGDHRDQRSYLAWCALWISECLRIVKPGGPLLVFSDWRQLPTTTDALQAGGFVWRGVVAWDKGEGVRPNLGFANQAEYIAWGTRGPINLGHEVYLPGVLRHPVVRGEKLHQTGKPLALLERLMAVVPAGGLVLDPFGGSATTAVAAQNTGRRALIVEVDPAHEVTAVERLRQGSLLALADVAEVDPEVVPDAVG